MKFKSTDLKHERLKELIHYDPATGIVTWKIERYRKHKGDVAGCTYAVSGRKNYRRQNISIDYKRYMMHRIIWFWMTGEWPELEIDHIDGDATNNKWSNLRQATRSQSAKNINKKHLSKTGVMGVRLTKWGYQARITVDRKEISLGFFESLEEASQARREAAIKFHGEFARID